MTGKHGNIHTTTYELFACQCQVLLKSMGKYTQQPVNCLHVSVRCDWKAWGNTTAHEPYPEGEIHTTAHEPYPEGEIHTATHEPYPEGPWQLHKGTSE